MDENRHSLSAAVPASEICFGLDRATDEQSLIAFLQRVSRDELLAVLAPRLSDGEISATLDLLSGLLRKHLSEQEYHRLFLSD